MKLTPIDWAAIIGALAWLPHLLKLAQDYFARPEVRLITAARPEIGFTTLGPIFNIRVAFVVTKKELVISGFRLILTHEDGDQRVFSWQGIVQTLGRHVSPEGGATPFEKELQVLALKISDRDADERLVRFHESSYTKEKQQYDDRAVKKGIHAKRQGQFDAEAFLRSEEMSEVFRFIKRSFPWKEGTYIAKFEIESPQGFSIVGDTYEFYLSAVDVEELEKNKEQVELDHRYRFTVPKPEDPQVVWAWRYPELIVLPRSVRPPQ